MLILITLGMISYLLSVQIKIGVPYWDVFNYLNNAVYYAGMNGGGVITYFPPVIPLLTSILFRMGYLSINAIFIVSGLIFLIGIIGFYLLLKQRFNSIQSLTGSLIFISLPVVLSWAVSGGIDIPGVVFSIWALYFTIIGLNKDSKFLYLVLPVFVIASLTRYTAGLMIIPIILCLLINFKNIKKIKNMKKVLLGIGIEIGALFLILVYFITKIDSAAFYNLFFLIVTSSSTGVGDVGYNPNLLYFSQNILNYISVGPFQGTYHQILNPSYGYPSLLSYLISLITVIGLSFYVYRGINSRIGFEDKSLINITNFIKIIILLALLSLLIISFYYKSLIFSEIFLLTLLYILYRFISSDVSEKTLRIIDMDFVFLSWFCAFFIFQSTLPFKVDRYFITMAPALVYFIILGLNQFLLELKTKIDNPNFKCGIIYIVIALVFLSTSTATYFGHTPKKSFTVDIGDASNWIKNYDPNYMKVVIGSDYPNAATWFFKKEVFAAFPRYFNNSDEFADYLQKNNVKYYIDTISNPHPDLKGYKIIKSIGVVVIYEKVNV
ncbi:MAG: glycosyltransferase family 39 protein [Methanobacteriaceae archaeon]|nr:glycosyltransferase family 39 protein [Methanobacteriaceae archaeon]